MNRAHGAMLTGDLESVLPELIRTIQYVGMGKTAKGKVEYQMGASLNPGQFPALISLLE